MNEWTDDELMAYADGELAPERREALQRALATDAALASRVARHAALRQRVGRAFDAMLAEPVPPRLQHMLTTAGPLPAGVADLSARREARMRRPLPTWAALGGMAASVVVGVLVGRLLPPSADAPGGATIVASAGLEAALSSQRAGASGGVAVPVSFVDKASGAYCRAFATAGQAGIACRSGGRWSIQALAAVDAAAVAPGTMRPASSVLPAAVLAEIDRRIDGAPLDATAEAEAVRSGWRR